MNHENKYLCLMITIGLIPIHGQGFSWTKAELTLEDAELSYSHFTFRLASPGYKPRSAFWGDIGWERTDRIMSKMNECKVLRCHVPDYKITQFCVLLAIE